MLNAELYPLCPLLPFWQMSCGLLQMSPPHPSHLIKICVGADQLRCHLPSSRPVSSQWHTRNHRDIVLRTLSLTPPMFQHLTNRDSLIDIAVEHQPYKIDAGFTHDVRYAQVVIHDLVDAVEGIFLVEDSVEQDSQSP